jgi:hypothetical protein
VSKTGDRKNRPVEQHSSYIKSTSRRTIMPANSDPDFSQCPPDLQEDETDLHPGISYTESTAWIALHASELDSSPEVIDWDRQERVAQVRALALLRNQFTNDHDIPILDDPWSDARYPSFVKVLGIDRLDEPCEIWLDQVWFQRVHPDRPHWWDVIATTTDDSPLTATELPDGTWADEGTRAYLEEMLARMLTSSTKRDRDLSLALSGALATGQLRYRHLHSVYNPDKALLRIEELYEFPIYSTAAWTV